MLSNACVIRSCCKWARMSSQSHFQVSIVVQTSILRLENQKERTSLLAFWIEVAEVILVNFYALWEHALNIGDNSIMTCITIFAY